MGNRFDTIIFDLDGTLADTAPDVLAGVNRALDKMGARPITLDQVKRAIGPGKEEFIRMVFPDTGKHDVKTFLTTFREIYWDHCLDQTKLFVGMDRVLEKLKDRTLGVASNKPRSFTEKILEGLGIRNLFDEVVGPEDVTHTKPHPEMIVRILERVGGKPSRTLFVGDTDKDMLAGRGAGVRVCGVRYGYGILEEIELQRPDFLVDLPLELLEIFEDSHG